MTKKNETTAPITDLEAKDFEAIRMMVRAALLARGISTDTVNHLLAAYRTVQPVFSAATRYYKSNDIDDRAKACEASNKAADYLLGKNVPKAAF